MAENRTYKSEFGFSPYVLTVLTDGFGRHGADVADISEAFKQRVRRMARNAEEAQELARLCSAMQRLSERILSDAFRAKVELSKIAPDVVTLTICRCGRSIEDGACPTSGRCSRGITTDTVV
jgi:lactate dehydrogenase-like 2-hydroxyacid dehydrogenase